MQRKPRDIDDYLSRAHADHRAALERLRRQVQAAAPRSEECITYNLPGFRLDGRVLVAFGDAARHCSLYPMSAAWIQAHRSELARYDTSKGTVRFQPEAPLPAALVRKLVRARIAENAARAKRAAGGAARRR
jgi:uncharacterized protein YdhG (YjbR/CyaY superfamily)